MNDQGGNRISKLFCIAESQAGYFTAAQARECGYSWALLSHHSKLGRFKRVARGVYRLRDYPSAPEEEIVSAWLAEGPQSVVSHETALGAFRLGEVIPQSVHVTVDRRFRHRRKRAGITVHTSLHPPAKHEVVVRGGVRMTAPARTILDVAEGGTDPDLVRRAIADALDRGLITEAELRRGAAERSRRVSSLVTACLNIR